MLQVDPIPAQVASQDWPVEALKIQVTPKEGAAVGEVGFELGITVGENEGAEGEAVGITEGAPVGITVGTVGS